MAQAAFASHSGSSFTSPSRSIGTGKTTHAKRSHTRPVDLVHLAKQSLGDRALELEILSLFRSQSALYLERLTNAKTPDDRKMAAHTILGSARGIGAWMVAEESEKIELSSNPAPELTGLAEAISEAQAYIDVILEA